MISFASPLFSFPFSCMNTKPSFIQNKKMSMPLVRLSSSSKTGISHPPEISKKIRDASFSSYLDGAEETFVLKLGGASAQSLRSSMSTPHDHIFLGPDDTEIDVFDAEKYFNEGLNHTPKNSSSHQQKKADPIGVFAIKEQPTIPTISLRSESSWNSRSALLHNLPRNQHPRKANKKSFLASIGCNCSCTDKNSVDIDDSVGEFVNAKSKQRYKTSDHLVRKSQSDYNCVKFDEPGLRVNPEGLFSFPVFNQTAKMQLQEKEDAAKRKSLEIFHSPVLENGKNNEIPQEVAEEIIIPPISSEMHDDSDSDSDTSSDLFEIESFSRGNSFLSRQASDGLSGTTSYAPSEASIEWSVITASAADFSVLSDSEELASKSTIPCPQKVRLNSKISSFREIPKLRSSILSGCKSQKAVRVAGDAHREYEHGHSSARKHIRPEYFMPMTRFHDENKMLGFDARIRKQAFDARVLSQSRSGSAAHLLYA